MDVLRVVRHLLRVTHRAQLLWRVSPQTPLESGGTGATNVIYRLSDMFTLHRTVKYLQRFVLES